MYFEIKLLKFELTVNISDLIIQLFTVHCILMYNIPETKSAVHLLPLWQHTSCGTMFYSKEYIHTENV
jgi:hypothetical protein